MPGGPGAKFCAWQRSIFRHRLHHHRTSLCNTHGLKTVGPGPVKINHVTPCKFNHPSHGQFEPPRCNYTSTFSLSSPQIRLIFNNSKKYPLSNTHFSNILENLKKTDDRTNDKIFNRIFSDILNN